jgi:hypothetical protein
LAAVLSTDNTIVVKEEECILGLLRKHDLIQIGNVDFKEELIGNEIINLQLSIDENTKKLSAWIGGTDDMLDVFK